VVRTNASETTQEGVNISLDQKEKRRTTKREENSGGKKEYRGQVGERRLLRGGGTRKGKNSLSAYTMKSNVSEKD